MAVYLSEVMLHQGIGCIKRFMNFRIINIAPLIFGYQQYEEP